MKNKTIEGYTEEPDLSSLFFLHDGLENYGNQQVQEYQKDEYIYHKGDDADKIHLVLSGFVKVASLSSDGREVVKGIWGEKDLFGEQAIVCEGKRLDYAQAAINGTEVCTIPLKTLQDQMQKNKLLTQQVLEFIGNRFRKTELKVESLVFNTARKRILEFLKERADRYGSKVGYETLIKNHFTHQDVASLTGTSRQTVTTVLNELRDKNLINFDRKQVLIRDMERLK